MLQITMDRLQVQLPKRQKFVESSNLLTLLENAKLEHPPSHPQNKPKNSEFNILLYYQFLTFNFNCVFLLKNELHLILIVQK